LLLLALSACAPAVAPVVSPPPSSLPPAAPKAEQPTFAETGAASWYGKSLQGKLTASGERFNPRAMTAAHPSLPFGTVIRVTSLETGQTVRVRVNDRGPFTQGRIIDLSAAAAERLGITRSGNTDVRLEEFASDQP